jgi:hypothetical protein
LIISYVEDYWASGVINNSDYEIDHSNLGLWKYCSSRQDMLGPQTPYKVPSQMCKRFNLSQNSSDRGFIIGHPDDIWGVKIWDVYISTG